MTGMNDWNVISLFVFLSISECLSGGKSISLVSCYILVDSGVYFNLYFTCSSMLIIK